MDDGLDFSGILQGTDKSSIGHGYLRHYERLLGAMRHEPITLLEIGVFRGASLSMWSEYFEKATIVGGDIQPECLKYATERCKIEIGSQADPNFLDGLGKKWRPHVIIDDGSHQASHVLLTFRTLYPHLREGGIFIVEDVHFHGGRFAHLWMSPSDVTPSSFFSQLAAVVSCPEANADVDRAITQTIDAVEFFYGGVAIRRKPLEESDPVAKRKPIVDRANRPEIWAAFATYVLNRSKDISYAEWCARRAIHLDPKEAGFHHILGLVLERAGDLPGASTAAREAVRLHPSQEQFNARLRDLEAKMK
jgi:hypothetical protein